MANNIKYFFFNGAKYSTNSNIILHKLIKYFDYSNSGYPFVDKITTKDDELLDDINATFNFCIGIT